LSAILALLWVRRGRLELAGNCLVLTSVVPVHALVLFAPSYAQPLGAAILMFAFDLVFLLLAVVFATRRVALAVLAIILTSQITFHVIELNDEPITGSLKFASDTLLRDGLIAFGVVFFLGITLVRMIEASYLRSEESLRESQATNENLGRLVADRTRDLEAASVRANEASRAKSDFLANMSHEIRTPLNGIIASADLLLERSDLPVAVSEHVRLIAESGDLLLKQLSDILDFSKIEAGQLTLETQRFELAVLVADCVTLLAIKAEQGGVRLDQWVAPELPRHLEGDGFRLRQVLLNLLANAIKFTPEGGRVRIAVTSAAPKSDPLPVRFEVSDTGIGMDADTLHRVFERFTQADSSTTRRYGGTGLGLAISSRIVAMMSGRIDAESSVGNGSVFHFTVPFRLAGIAPAATPAPRLRPTHLGLRVLVAEDNVMNRKIIGAQLTELGCLFVMAVDGEEALVELLKDPLPDVVMMDCHMPTLDGWEATRRLRGWATEAGVSERKRRVAKIPVIALTAAALPEERARCLDAGMNEFLAKPVKLADLQRILASFVRAAK
jgi:signal transduction histidine kinase/CheY-like chemotaxis protein